MIRLPIDSTPLQKMSVDPGDGSPLNLTIRYNSVGDHWELDVQDRTTDAVIVQAVPLVLGPPILWRDTVDYLLWLEDLSGVGLDPIGGDDLGERFALYVGLKSEVAQ
ncbi:phage baseplate plug family protein [Paraburkholderia sp. MM5477-R1]|uniref:phage baseplate plug family protein n=1 Tax=Paraburkholderia sp. MM5477-R1 TaxID=2991062 RepID=UPI003D23D2A7